MIALALSLSAFGQSVDTLSPAGGAAFGRGSIQGESAEVHPNERAAGVFTSLGQDAGSPEKAPVEVVFPLVVLGSQALGQHVRFDLQIPFYPQVRADATGWSGPAFGDVRLGAVVPLWQTDRAGVALSPFFRFPTGTADALVAGGAAGGLTLVADASTDHLGFTTNLGFTGASAKPLPSGAGSIGSSIDVLGAGWAKTGHFRAGLEAGGGFGLGSLSSGVVDVFAQAMQSSGFGLAVSAGGGFGYAPGTRVVAAISWSRQDFDRDHDGVSDADDQCADEAEDRDDFSDDDGCPDPDDDRDGVLDLADACRELPEDVDGWQDADGCPEPDNDGDSIADAEDRCPDVAGPVSQHGCIDRDDDGLDDAVDACPDKPGPKGEAHGDGCPKEAWIGPDARIGLATPLAFDYSGALTAESTAELGGLAALLNAHPEIAKISVEAHVHTAYPENEAASLTRVRAERVKAALVAAGVAPERIETHGYGATRPIDTNKTATGRARNERVEIAVPPG
jgi:hypothetical protein